MQSSGKSHSTVLASADPPGDKQPEGKPILHDVQPNLYPTVIRDMNRHENDVTNHRIMWLLNVQRLVANAYQFLFVIGLFLLGACMASGRTSTSCGSFANA